MGSLKSEASAKKVGVHTLSPGMVLTDLLLEGATLENKQIFNILCEQVCPHVTLERPWCDEGMMSKHPACTNLTALPLFEHGVISVTPSPTELQLHCIWSTIPSWVCRQQGMHSGPDSVASIIQLTVKHAAPACRMHAEMLFGVFAARDSCSIPGATRAHGGGTQVSLHLHQVPHHPSGSGQVHVSPHQSHQVLQQARQVAMQLMLGVTVACNRQALWNPLNCCTD